MQALVKRNGGRNRIGEVAIIDRTNIGADCLHGGERGVIDFQNYAVAMIMQNWLRCHVDYQVFSAG